MVLCCASECSRCWFHMACVGLEITPTQDWFCSDECRDGGSYIYCICHEQKGGLMVRCKLESDCTRQEWFHTNCLNLTQRGVQGMQYIMLG
jgi:hypothetical protein